MIESRSDIQRHQQAVRKYLAIPAEDLGITKDMEEATATRYNVTAIGPDRIEDFFDCQLDSYKTVPVLNLKDFLGNISTSELGDVAFDAEERKYLRENFNSQYQAHLQLVNKLENMADSKKPENSLLKHIVFLDALEDLLSTGTRMPPQVIRDELNILSGTIQDYNRYSAKLSEENEKISPDDHKELFGGLASAMIAQYKVQDKRLPYYASHLEPQIERMMDMPDGKDKTGLLIKTLDELSQLMHENTNSYDLVELTKLERDAGQACANEYEGKTNPLRKVYAATIALANDLDIDVRKQGRNAS